VTTPTQAPAQLKLQLDVFEGPLELLLSLVEGHRLPVAQISLASLADQYLEQVYAMPELDADLLADFLAIAGKLLLLKSRALLLNDEPDPVVEETAAELEERLAQYRVFKLAAEQLQKLEAAGERLFPTRREPSLDQVEAPLAPITAAMLLTAWRQMLAEPEAPKAEIPVRLRASVDQRRALILDLLKLRPSISFSDIAGNTVDEVVATFLALLELFRRAQVRATQTVGLGEIVLTAA
jgi:segregation and condensation protein A